MESIDELLKESAELVPNVSEGLKNSILEEYEIRKDKKHNFFNRKRITMCLSFMSAIVALLVFIPIMTMNMNSKASSDKSDTEDTYSYVKKTYSKRITDSSIVDYSSGIGSSLIGSVSSSFYKSSASSSIDKSDDAKGDIEKEPEEYFINFGKFEDNVIVNTLLTSSVVNDNDKYEYFKSLLVKGQEKDGEFLAYQNYSFNLKNRIKVTIDKGLSAKVKLIDEKQNVVYEAVVDRFGNAYLFPSEKKNYTVVIEGSSYKYTYNNINSDLDLTQKLGNLSNEKVNKIELMFVIDTTGSMSDELEYLKVEIDDVIDTIKKENENVEIYLALMMYRDEGDDYVTRYSDFTTDIKLQQEFLKAQSSDGGGDFEEAVTVALNEALNKNWSSDDSTKILVHVADAPAHNEDVDSWNIVSKELSKKGVKIITVASSGIDKKTEYFMRAEAIMTGGYYGYLTDDSGIGNSHIEATTDEKPTVEYLNKMLIRLISGIHKGDLEAPVGIESQYEGLILTAKIKDIEVVKNVLENISVDAELLYSNQTHKYLLVYTNDIEMIEEAFKNVDVEITIEKNYIYSIDHSTSNIDKFEDSEVKIDEYDRK